MTANCGLLRPHGVGLSRWNEGYHSEDSPTCPDVIA